MRSQRWTSIATLVAFLLMSLNSTASQPDASSPPRLPSSDLNLRLTAPITTWDEAVPLGNGLCGGLLWGEGNLLRLSLDRGDLWDLRTPPQIHEPGFTYANLQKLVSEKNQAEISRLFDAPYSHPTPTKIPAGRLEIVLDPSQKVDRFELDLATAQGQAHLGNNHRCDALFSATAPVAMLQITGPEPKQLRLLVPGSGIAAGTGPDSHLFASLNYPKATHGSEGLTQWFIQPTAGALKFCVCAESRRTGSATQIAVAITSTADGPDPLHLARQRVTQALNQGYDASLQPHATWWASFWDKSRVSLPDASILRQYYLVRYFYGAASRRGAPPMPLQGVWTADAGGLPPWKGDYHNDLNTQMTYMGYQAAGHFDEGLAFLDFNANLLPAYRKFARDFFHTPGANVPGVMAIDGAPLTGWAQYSLSPTMSAWIAHVFYLHWRYTADNELLRTTIYPWCSEIGLSAAALLKPDAQGILCLPLSSSPEVYDNSLRAWLKPNTNYDYFLLRMLFLALRDMALELGDRPAAERWGKLAAQLGDCHLAPDGTLLLAQDDPLPASHRHLSNLIGIYPLNLLTPDGTPRDLRAILASLAQWDRLGTSAWCGYSFSWMSALQARVGNGQQAAHLLETFVRAFVLRNGFHANGDQTQSGLSSFTYRPFTLEGNMLAAAAVHEMLLQSWSPQPGSGDWGVIRLFPAVPAKWSEVSFDDLRCEGAHRVSARRNKGVTTWFRIVAGRSGILKIRDNFGPRTPQWNRQDVTKTGADYQVTLQAGEVLEATIPRP